MTHDDGIRLQGQLEVADLIRTNYWFLLHKFGLLLGPMLVLMLLYPLFYFAGAFGPRQPGQSNWGFLYAPTFMVVMVLAIHLGVRRQFASNKALTQTIHYTFSAAGIQVAGPLSSGHSSWETIRSAHETRRSFLLFISNNQMHTLPRRFFTSEEQISDFRRLLKASVGKRAKIRLHD